MIEKIGHYSITNPATVYDEEALTALELAGRTAGKVNECVEHFNTLEEETNAHLAQQDAQIPVKVEHAVQDHIDDGSFDEAIDRYAGELQDRLENLIENTPEGSTTMDVEVVDIRYGANGVTYDSAGEAVREQVINPLNPSTWSDKEVTFTYTDTDDVRTFTVNFPTFYILTGEKSVTVASRTLTTEQSKSQSLFRFIYNQSTKEIDMIYHSNTIPTGYVYVGTLHTKYGAFLNGNTHHHKEHALAIAPLILGKSNAFIEFDSTNKYVKIPKDTLMMMNHQKPVFKQITPSDSDVLVSYSELSYTALILYYDLTTETFGVVKYNDALSINQVVIATFRTTGSVSILAPYKWDSKPYNIDINPFTQEIEVDNVNENVKSINHRGDSSEATENTLEAFRISAEKGMKYVECDVRFTSDGVPVLLHDATVDRVSDGTGNISEMTLEQAQQLDFGGEKIATFNEFIALCKGLGLHPYVELKAGTETQIKELVGIVRMYGMRDNVTYISFNSSFLEYVKNTDIRARLGLVVNSIEESTITAVKALKTGKNEVFIDVDSTAVSDDVISMCASANIPVEVWTVNDASYITSMNPYITGVTSDTVHAGDVLRDNDFTGVMTAVPSEFESEEEESSGGGKIYHHHIKIQGNSVEFYCHMYTSNETPFTYETFKNHLFDMDTYKTNCNGVVGQAIYNGIGGFGVVTLTPAMFYIAYIGDFEGNGMAYNRDVDMGTGTPFTLTDTVTEA